MPTMNLVVLCGNLTREVEQRTTQGGAVVSKVGIAVNRRWSQNGEQKESTCFVDLVAFGRTAEVLAQYCHKGSAILVHGRLEYSSWEADDGTKRNKLEVVIENFQFLDPRGQDPEKGGTRERYRDKHAETPPGRDSVNDDPSPRAKKSSPITNADIPF